MIVARWSNAIASFRRPHRAAGGITTSDGFRLDVSAGDLLHSGNTLHL